MNQFHQFNPHRRSRAVAKALPIDASEQAAVWLVLAGTLLAATVAPIAILASHLF